METSSFLYGVHLRRALHRKRTEPLLSRGMLGVTEVWEFDPWIDLLSRLETLLLVELERVPWSAGLRSGRLIAKCYR